MRLLQYSLKPGEDKKVEATKFQSAIAGAIEAVARAVRCDPVYSQLYQCSTRMTGQVAGMIGDLLKMAPVAGLEPSLEITQAQVLTVCRAVRMNAEFPLLIGGLPQQGGRYATVIEGLKHWRGRSKENFQRLMVFSAAVKPEHLVLAANVEHSSFYAFLDQLPSDVGGTLEFMATTLFSQVQAARNLKQYAERYLARRAGNL